MSHVLCHMSHFMWNMPNVPCHMFFFSYKWWCVLVEGLLSTGPTPSSRKLRLWGQGQNYITLGQDCNSGDFISFFSAQSWVLTIYALQKKTFPNPGLRLIWVTIYLTGTRYECFISKLNSIPKNWLKSFFLESLASLDSLLYPTENELSGSRKWE